MEIITKNAKETKEVGRKIGSSLKGGEIIALVGDLGAGKTTFVQGLASGIGIEKNINSPTFILMRTYEIKLIRNVRIRKLYHLDFYRLEGDVESQVRELGIEDTWGEVNNVTVIEWADKATGIWPKETIWIKFEKLNDEQRKISINNL